MDANGRELSKRTMCSHFKSNSLFALIGVHSRSAFKTWVFLVGGLGGRWRGHNRVAVENGWVTMTQGSPESLRGNLGLGAGIPLGFRARCGLWRQQFQGNAGAGLDEF